MLRSLSLDDLRVEDERSFSHVELYDDLKQRLRRDGYRFRAPARGDAELSWDRALFLNLTFWQAGDQSDVLVAERVPADVVVHVGWHHVARTALGDAAASADGMLLGEAIASASDLYLVGRLLGHAPDAELLATQVPAMRDAADAAGLDDARFEQMLTEVSDAPERAFEDLRALLFDASTALVRCASVDQAEAALGSFDGHRFAPLLHHYELSNWILHGKASASSRLAPDPAVRAVDQALRGAADPIAWLTRNWIDPKTA